MYVALICKSGSSKMVDSPKKTRLSNLMALCVLPFGMAGATSAASQGVSGASDFEGAYAGLELGAVRADGDADYPVLAGGTVSGPYDPDNGRGYGILAGYNVQNGNVVYGAELRYTNLIDVSERGASDAEIREVLDVADIRGRVGYARGDVLIYGSLGWSWSRFRVHPSRLFEGRDSQITLDGFNVGLGVEYNFSENWYVGGDFTYRDISGRFDEANNDTDVDLSTISARVAYRF